MASSKVMVTTSTTNTDLPCQPSICSSLSSSILADFQNQDRNPGDTQALGSMNMDDLLKNIYSTPTLEQVGLNGASMTREGVLGNNGDNSNANDDNKSVDEVWKQIVAGSSDQRRGGAEDEEMTLEDFLTKAGAVREEDVRAYGNNNNNNNNNITNNNSNNNNITDENVNNNYHNNDDNNDNSNQMVIVGRGGGGRGKRRVVEEPPMDKATQQKQRRMIKNRESAARSRERKQAYTVELESLVTQLEEENSRLVREEAEQNKERFKQLMENLIPVVEQRRPPRVLRRVHSLHW